MRTTTDIQRHTQPLSHTSHSVFFPPPAQTARERPDKERVHQH